MPELPEVNRVANILKGAALGKTVDSVTTTEDSIIYCDGITNVDFVRVSFGDATSLEQGLLANCLLWTWLIQEKELKGRKIVDVGRRGKVFFLKLSGEGRHPVMQ